MGYKTAAPDRYELLRSFARANRKNMTLSEQILWNVIRKKDFGVRFLRQHVIGDYIVDFICIEEKLIIEVDGGYHSEPKQQNEDPQREEWLKAHGFRVIRVKNEEIMNELPKVINIIKITINH